MRKKSKDIIVVGFALFSMLFGAGNLLFPPYLGLISGKEWITSLTGFVLADVGISLLVLAACAKHSGDLDKVLNRAGKNVSKLIGIAAILCIGPLLAIPRTAATTLEMGIVPILGKSNIIISIISSIIFFGLTLALAIRQSKVVDIIGKILTPTLLIALLILIIKGIMNPIGDLNSAAMIENLFQEGVSQGYLTMDALGVAALATVIIASIDDRGYKNSNEKIKLTMKSGLVAGIGLIVVYGGLMYLGAMLSNMDGNPYGVNTPQASLMVVLTNILFGYTGKVILCVIVTLACLTTAIGLTSATAKYFSSIANGKLKYKSTVIAICLFSLVVSNFGVDTIIKFSSPILEVVYPVLMVLAAMSLIFGNIKNDNVFKGAALATFIVSLLTVANSLWGVSPVMIELPLASFGFNWIVPAIIGGLIGNFIKTPSKTNTCENE
ncbi:MAG: branched-chain amino acid transport system II carrier protein [Romboutsia sp.]|nr:branched-chain amino acid transport system II carrier protein [Romboutsia sp.]